MKARRANGDIIECKTVENLGYSHDTGHHMKRVRAPNGDTFMAAGGRGAWREWTPADRARRLIEHYAREAQRKAEEAATPSKPERRTRHDRNARSSPIEANPRLAHAAKHGALRPARPMGKSVQDRAGLEIYPHVRAELEVLRGTNLACFCRSAPCPRRCAAGVCKPMTKFAEGTSVPVEKSRAEIEKMIVRYGATSTAFMTGPGRAVIVFECKARRVMFELPLPDMKDSKFAYDGRHHLLHQRSGRTPGSKRAANAGAR
jgi:hypothetical protein